MTVLLFVDVEAVEDEKREPARQKAILFYLNKPNKILAFFF